MSHSRKCLVVLLCASVCVAGSVIYRYNSPPSNSDQVAGPSIEQVGTLQAKDPEAGPSMVQAGTLQAKYPFVDLGPRLEYEPSKWTRERPKFHQPQDAPLSYRNRAVRFEDEITSRVKLYAYHPIEGDPTTEASPKPITNRKEIWIGEDSRTWSLHRLHKMKASEFIMEIWDLLRVLMKREKL